jgi:short-subunit dehydrogenase
MDVVITGASQGIGRALALRFSQIERIHLYLISRNEKKLTDVAALCKKKNSGCVVNTIPYDLDRILYEELPGQLDCDHIDILINNAGLLIKKDFASLSSDEMMDLVTTNFLAPACLISKAISRLGGNAPSHIINMGSMAGFQGSKKFSGLSMYSATKAALASLTECLAAEYEGKNIYFNCLAIGSVETEMLAKAFPTLRAPLVPEQMAEFIFDFALNGYKYFNGKVLPVAVTTP